MAFLDDVLAAVGGTGNVPLVRIAGIGQTVSSGKLQTWDDARGSVGYGPTATAVGSPKPAVDAITGKVTCDGSQNYYATAASSVFDLSNEMTLVFVGSIQSSYSLIIQNDPLSYWDGLVAGGGAGGIYSYLLPGTDSRQAASSSTIIAIRSYAGASPSGSTVVGDTSRWLEVVGRVPTGIIDDFGVPSGGNRLLSIGNAIGVGYHAATEFFCMVVDHQLTSTEHNDLVALLLAQYPDAVPDLSHGSLIFDGDSRTAGSGSSSAANTYPAKVLTTLGLGSTYDDLNAGVPSRKAVTQLAQFDKRIAPLYRAGKAGEQIYIIWGSFINDVLGGYTALQARTHIVDNCLAAQAAGFRVVVTTEIPWSGSPESDRLAFNSYMRANYASFADELADIALIPEFVDPYDATKYADVYHPNDDGYDLIANHATYGIAAAISRALAQTTEITVGSITGVATASAVVHARRVVSATVAGVATATTVLHAMRALAASTAGTSTVSTTIKARRALQALAAGQGTPSVALHARHALTALVAGAAAVSVALGRAGSTRIDASAAGSSTVSVLLAILPKLTVGTIAGLATVAAALGKMRATAAAATGSSTVTVQIRARRAIRAQVDAGSTVNITANARRAILVSVGGTSSVFANPRGEEASTAAPVGKYRAEHDSALADLRSVGG